MTGEAYKALDMLNLFASVGVQRVDLTLTNGQGEKLSFLANRPINELRHTIGKLLSQATEAGHNVIARPRPNGRADIIQLDDLTEAQAQRFEHRAFMTLCTSPGNYQAWVAVTDSQPDFARRLRKGAGADPSASGATRISGSRNFKAKYAPAFPVIEITGSNGGLTQTRAELQAAGLVAPKTAPAIAAGGMSRQRYGGKSPRAWPSYQKCVDGAPPIHGGDDRPDISKADFVWCMTAIDWGHGTEATAEKLLTFSTKARENGEAYAALTAQNAAEAVTRRRGLNTTRQ